MKFYSTNHNVEFYSTDIDFYDLPLTVDFNYYSGHPAKINCPPEDAYPAEPDAVVLKNIWLRGEDCRVEIDVSCLRVQWRGGDMDFEEALEEKLATMVQEGEI